MAAQSASNCLLTTCDYIGVDSNNFDTDRVGFILTQTSGTFDATVYDQSYTVDNAGFAPAVSIFVVTPCGSPYPCGDYIGSIPLEGVTGLDGSYAEQDSPAGIITSISGNIRGTEVISYNLSSYEFASYCGGSTIGACDVALEILGPVDVGTKTSTPPPPPPPPPPSPIYISHQTSGFATWDDQTQWLDGNGNTVEQKPSSSNPVFVIPGPVSAQVFFGAGETAQSVTVESGTLGGVGPAELDGLAGSSLNNTTLSVVGNGIVSLFSGASLTTTGDTVVGGAYVDPTGSYGGAGGPNTGTFNNEDGTHTVGGTLLIGDTAGSTGNYNLSGGGTLNVTGKIELGGAGTGNFKQTDQNSAVTANGIDIGAQNGGQGTWTATNGSVKVTGDLMIGDAGKGTFNEQGPNVVVSADDVFLGNASDSNGAYNLSDGTLMVSTGLYVGFGGTGTFNQTGGSVTVGNGVYIGASEMGKGTYLMSGGSLTIMGQEPGLVIGETGGGGVLTVTGGMISTSKASIGDTAGDTGTMTLSGSNASWVSNPNTLQSGKTTVNGSIIVGNAGIGHLNVQAGASVNNSTTLSIGELAGSTGTVAIDSSTWANGGDVEVGNAGNGMLNVTNRASFTNTGGLIIGSQSGGVGAVDIDNSMWSDTGAVQVGSSGQGSLTIANGAKLTDGSAEIGVNVQGQPAQNTVTVQNSTWTSTGSLQIGVGGAGQLTISQGGQVTSGSGDIGVQSGSTGTVTVTDQGSTWSLNGGKLTVGDAGAGALTIQSGGLVQSGATVLGAQKGAPTPGMATVTGTGSSWQTQTLTVGASGAGSLTVSQDGAVSASGNAIVGQHAAGTLTVTDPGSQFTVGGDLSVGNSGQPTAGGGTGSSGSGTMTVQNQAMVNVTGGVTLGANPGDTGNLTVTDNGTSLTVGQSITVGGAGNTFNVQNGALVQADSLSIGGSATLTGAGSEIDVGSLTVAAKGGSSGNPPSPASPLDRRRRRPSDRGRLNRRRRRAGYGLARRRAIGGKLEPARQSHRRQWRDRANDGRERRRPQSQR